MRPPRMRRRLYMVWLVLAILCAMIIVHEVTDIFAPTPPPRTGRLPLFAFREPELDRVQVIHRGRVIAFMRNAAGAWFNHGASHGHRHEHDSGQVDHHHADANAPESASSSPSSSDIAERMDLITRMLADRRVKPTQRLEHYGLSNPQTTIVFYGRRAGASEPLGVLYIGDLLPHQYAYYAMRSGDRELSLIPHYYIDLLLALAFGEDQMPTPLKTLINPAP